MPARTAPIFALALSLVLGACATTGAAEKPAIVLLHGAFEDASVWAETEALLEAKGYRVETVNLPGRPSSPAPSPATSLEAYRAEVIRVIDTIGEPVVLVGHSFGGMSISNVAEAAPEKIRTLVYLAAYLPQSGQALTDLSAQDSGSQAGPAFQIDGARGVASIAYDARAGLFCNDCSADVAAALPAQMVEEPLVPVGTPVTLTPERFGTVDKAYIRTRRDLVVSPVLQDIMLAATPVREEVVLDTGHAPFLSNPPALSAAIIEALTP